MLNIPISTLYDSSAPWCEEIVTCPNCDGAGHIFAHWQSGSKLTAEQYDKLSPEEQEDYEEYHCECCDGIGEVDKRYVDFRRWR